MSSNFVISEWHKNTDNAQDAYVLSTALQSFPFDLRKCILQIPIPNRKWQDYVYIQCEYKSTKQRYTIVGENICAPPYHHHHNHHHHHHHHHIIRIIDYYLPLFRPVTSCGKAVCCMSRYVHEFSTNAYFLISIYSWGDFLLCVEWYHHNCPHPYIHRPTSPTPPLMSQTWPWQPIFN